jgi:hypothetical protein
MNHLGFSQPQACASHDGNELATTQFKRRKTRFVMELADFCKQKFCGTEAANDSIRLNTAAAKEGGLFLCTRRCRTADARTIGFGETLRFPREIEPAACRASTTSAINDSKIAGSAIISW